MLHCCAGSCDIVLLHQEDPRPSRQERRRAAAEEAKAAALRASAAAAAAREKHVLDQASPAWLQPEFIADIFALVVIEKPSHAQSSRGEVLQTGCLIM